MILGDAIVWWRVLAIWPRSFLVHVTCLFLLMATLGMYRARPRRFVALTRVLLLGTSILDAVESCPASVFQPLWYDNLYEVPSGALFQQNLLGLSASVLSLATNLVASALIWCKAWYVRDHREGKRSRFSLVADIYHVTGNIGR